jgi:nicotinic acid mononucleotide adenylyltransferase
MSFKKYIDDLKNTKSVVYCFGRFNPPHKGHELLFDFVAKEAKKRKADGIIYPAQLNHFHHNE